MNSPDGEAMRELFLHSLLDFWASLGLAAANGVTVSAARPGASLLDVTGVPGADHETLAQLGAAAHWMDFDDVHGPSRTHASAILMPVILLERGPDATLDDCATSYAAGLQAMTTLYRALGSDALRHQFHPSALLGPVGACAALLRLSGVATDSPEADAAISMALAASIGYRSQFGTDTKPWQVGDAAARGWLARRRAAAGHTAAPALDAVRAMAQVVGEDPPANAVPEWATPDIDVLGRFWRKRTPVCSAALGVADAGMALARERGPDAVPIRRVTLSFPEGGDAALVHRRPRSWEEGRFSAEYVFACAFLDVSLFPTGQSGIPPHVQAVMDATVRDTDPALQDTYAKGGRPVAARVEWADGETRECRVDQPVGGPGKPLSLETLLARFDSVGSKLGWKPAEQLLSDCERQIL